MAPTWASVDSLGTAEEEAASAVPPGVQGASVELGTCLDCTDNVHGPAVGDSCKSSNQVEVEI